jgi:hypothetical protein
MRSTTRKNTERSLQSDVRSAPITGTIVRVERAAVAGNHCADVYRPDVAGNKSRIAADMARTPVPIVS